MVLREINSFKVLITGSTDGIGLMNAKQFAKTSNKILIHGHNKDIVEKAKDNINKQIMFLVLLIEIALYQNTTIKCLQLI